MMNFIFIFIFVTLGAVNAFKILVYNPKLGQSHTNFMGKLADALIDAGHDVAVYQPILNENVTFRGFKSPKIRHYVLPKNMSLYKGFSVNENQKALWNNDLASKMRETAKHRIQFCAEVMDDEKNLALLKSENFDLGITEHFEVCGYGVLKRLNVTKYVACISNALFPLYSSKLGIKPHWSYVNGFTVAYSDEMNFLQRVHGFLSYFLEVLIVDPIVKSSEKAIQKYYPNFDSDAAFRNAAFVFVNADEHLDYIQPITPKIIYIGNLGIGTSQPLSDEFEKIVSKSQRGFVLFSFGSVVQAKSMPSHLKQVFLSAFQAFPNVTFLWKYETPEDGTAHNIPNVITRKWLPQRDLLNHPKILAFITHGGQNSFNEAIGAGIPLLCVPVFGDQPKNAQHVVSNGLGLQLHHNGLTAIKVVEALREILENNTYRNNAQQISRIMKAKGKWQTPEDRFVKNVELAAEFGNFGTLDATGAEQNAIVFYSLDVIGFLIIIFIFTLFLIFSLCFKMLSLCRESKQKTD